MKLSNRWFNKRSNQATSTGIADLPVLAMLGPKNDTQAEKTQNEKGQRYFRAGVSRIGGEDVIK